MISGKWGFLYLHAVGKPDGQMSKLLTFSLLLLFACTKVDRYNLFKIESFDKFEFLDLEKVNDIRTFNKKFWRADSIDNDFTFVAKFDFVKGDFSNHSDKGLKLEGLPFPCLEYDCNRRYGQKFYLSNNYEVLNDDNEILSDDQIKELVKVNILNYGKDPSLSDEPREAATEVYLKPVHRIEKLGHVFKVIADGYVDLIEKKKIETKWTVEKLTYEFPFRLHLRQNMIPNDSPKIIELEGDDWDVKDFEIDTTMVRMK